VQDDGLADDIAQEVFVRLNRLDRVDYPYAWLRRVTHRLALNWERDRKRRSEILDTMEFGWAYGNEHTVVEELVAHDMVQWIELEIETWPVEFRETARMLIRGAKPADIQEALKLNSGTVSSRIHRIRKRLDGFFVFQKQDE
jgi:DNA-directed RNA polymerase specialized sigma24 family protein